MRKESQKLRKIYRKENWCLGNYNLHELYIRVKCTSTKEKCWLQIWGGAKSREAQRFPIRILKSLSGNLWRVSNASRFFLRLTSKIPKGILKMKSNLSSFSFSEITRIQSGGKPPGRDSKFVDIYHEKPIRLTVRALVPVKEHPKVSMNIYKAYKKYFVLDIYLNLLLIAVLLWLVSGFFRCLKL